MGIVRVNELPEGSGSLSNDDIFLFMDDPSGSGITKKISLSEIGSAIGGGVAETSSLTTTVFNKTGSPIPKFRIVYINGGQGDMPTIALASNTGEATSSKTYGITAEAIGNMSSGKVIVEGALTGLNTDQFNPTAPIGDVNGTILYLSTASGLVTTTKPSAPDHLVSVGTIVRTHQNQGVVEVRIQNGFEIQELHNVAINGVSNNQVLVYNSGNSLWENKNPSSITPLQNSVSISGTINNWNPTLSDIIYASGSPTITGLDSSYAYKTFVITNVSDSGAITLSHENAGSSGNNRFICPNNVDYTLPSKNNSILIIRDTVNNKWRLLY